jgi:SAM-dependent methyltransferase
VTTQPFVCRVCSLAQEAQVIAAREMMYGTGEPFEYVACADCECVQLLAIPPDLGRYYPADYYSMDAPHEPVWRAFLKSRRAAHARGDLTLVGRAMARFAPNAPAPPWIADAGLRTEDKVLDIGCGGGQLLLQLRDLGFTDLTGVDPFISTDIEHRGVRILKRQLGDVPGRYAFVMLHHSLEHMPDQLGTMRQVRGLIAPGGRALVRIPLLGYAWRNYGVDWLGLDPPRHVYAHSVKSFSLVAERAGFRVASLQYDSSALQFWSAEQFRRGISLWSPQSVARGATHLFSAKQLAELERRAEELNRTGDGDQGAFLLEPI